MFSFEAKITEFDCQSNPDKIYLTKNASRETYLDNLYEVDSIFESNNNQENLKKTLLFLWQEHTKGKEIVLPSSCFESSYDGDFQTLLDRFSNSAKINFLLEKINKFKEELSAIEIKNVFVDSISLFSDESLTNSLLSPSINKIVHVNQSYQFIFEGKTFSIDMQYKDDIEQDKDHYVFMDNNNIYVVNKDKKDKETSLNEKIDKFKKHLTSIQMEQIILEKEKTVDRLSEITIDNKEENSSNNRLVS